MIPLYKLEKLPRIQKLRKIAKVFTMAEKRFAPGKGIEIFTNAEILFFTDAAKLLAADALFCKRQGLSEEFANAANVFQTHDVILFRRALNSIKHILFAETGKDQSDWDFTNSNGSLDPQKRQIFKGMHVYMEDIRSPFNVGAMFRTAESFGVEKIILSPFCADPLHRRAERTAMGCIDIIPWERQEFLPDNLPVFALETGGIPLSEFSFPRQGLLIAGSEELGVSPNALAAADASLGRVSIPCYGAKASLNVSVAFGIALQAWAKSNNDYQTPA
ncbi:MAG: TrmH family RNA methyltransferase [Treponema sp.]|nr:TrmH family RNA methyltransferase [Treponema sp.]